MPQEAPVDDAEIAEAAKTIEEAEDVPSLDTTDTAQDGHDSIVKIDVEESLGAVPFVDREEDAAVAEKDPEEGD